MSDRANQKITLYGYRRDNVAITDALHDCKDFLPNGTPGFVYGRDCALFAIVKIDDGTPSLKYGPDRREPGDIFEVRLFTEKCELRWAADAEKFEPDGKTVGSAVLLSEKENMFDSNDAWNSGNSQVCTVLTNQYILWGEAENASDNNGWTRLFDHRIGDLWVPLPFPDNEKERTIIRFTEYVAEDNEFGNLAVKAERLTGLHWS